MDLKSSFWQNPHLVIQHVPGVLHVAVVLSRKGMVAGPGCSKGVDVKGEGVELFSNVKGCQRGHSTTQRVPSQHYPENRGKVGRVRSVRGGGGVVENNESRGFKQTSVMHSVGIKGTCSYTDFARKK